MESYQHLLISGLASPVSAYFLLAGEPVETILAWSLIGIAAGVFIDLDHFLLARLNTGNWERLTFALNNPFDAFSDGKKTMQNSITSKQRYLSHLILTSAATAIIYTASGSGPALLVLAVMSLHVGCDLCMSCKKFLDG